MFGSKYPCVSVTSGATSAVASIKKNLEYLQSFDHVRLCFDSDAPGQEAVAAVAGLFSPGKVSIVRKPKDIKDANEFLKLNKAEEYTRLWWNAELWTPQGIIPSGSLLDYLKNHKVPPSVSLPYNKLQAMIGGLRQSELVVVTAQTSVGKTSFLRELIYHMILQDKSLKIGTMFNEETYRDSAMGLLSLHTNKRLDLPETKYDEEEFDAAFNELLIDNSVYFYDHFGSTHIDEVEEKIKYYARGLGCKYFFLDHITMLATGGSGGDERRELDNIAYRLKNLTMELNIGMVCVVHKNRQGEIRGTAGIEQVANIVINLDRDIRSTEEQTRNTTALSVWKNRFSGRTGPAGFLSFNHETGRLEELPDEPEVSKKIEEELNKEDWVTECIN
jgi:twinkle protein